ncbi:hypothetical protein [Burkholderia gladioli]|uniref:hypothetical protein n=1 Tax=Burkholderia gladioli TaxID=28095 RepID=UPI0016408ECF|nr:hypothetical protein [Burkholderia gladioli]
MSNNGQFVIEEDDIVKLESNRETTACAGWVNVGTHAVWIQLAENGDLEVEVNPRENEGGALGKISVSAAESVEAGGVDPD